MVRSCLLSSPLSVSLAVGLESYSPESVGRPGDELRTLIGDESTTNTPHGKQPWCVGCAWMERFWGAQTLHPTFLHFRTRERLSGFGYPWNAVHCRRTTPWAAPSNIESKLEQLGIHDDVFLQPAAVRSEPAARNRRPADRKQQKEDDQGTKRSLFDIFRPVRTRCSRDVHPNRPGVHCMRGQRGIAPARPVGHPSMHTWGADLHYLSDPPSPIPALAAAIRTAQAGTGREAPAAPPPGPGRRPLLPKDVSVLQEPPHGKHPRVSTPGYRPNHADLSCFAPVSPVSGRHS